MIKYHDSWTMTVEMPIGYQNGDGNRSRTATVRKLTGHEEPFFEEPEYKNNTAMLVTKLLTNCVTEIEGKEQIHEEDVLKLNSADRETLIFAIRQLTFGNYMQAHYRCPHCHGVTSVLEDLSTLEKREISDDEVPEVHITLKDGYLDPDGNWQREFSFRWPIGKDEKVAAGLQDPNPTRKRDVLWTRCLKKVGDLESRQLEALGSRILKDLSMADRRLIQKTMDEKTPGLNLIRDIICHQCGESYQAPLDVTRFFSLD